MIREIILEVIVPILGEESVSTKLHDSLFFILRERELKRGPCRLPQSRVLV